MDILALILTLILMALLFYLWANRNRGGLPAPGRKEPEPEPKPNSGTYYEISNACHTLRRSGSGSDYRATIFPDRNISDIFVITKTTVKGLPAGIQALLTHRLFPHGQPDPNAVTKGTQPLTDRQSSNEFNGKAGLIDASKFPKDIIVWEATLSLTSGSTASLPESFEVCVDLRKDV